MTWGCSPITALLTSMCSAPPIIDKKDKRANAKRNRRRGAKLGPDAARRSSPPALMDKEDERASLRRDADDVVIRFAGILEIAGAQLKPASFWAVSLTDRVYVAAGGRPR
jgi:hypothetical protein